MDYPFEPIETIVIAGGGTTGKMRLSEYADKRGFLWYVASSITFNLKIPGGATVIDRWPSGSGFPAALDAKGLLSGPEFVIENGSGSFSNSITFYRPKR